ncbi:MAG: NAD(P)/FAD-dependent oxidoreductase [Spirosomataceae bacterium]
MFDIIVIGGGLAGLVSSIQLAKAGQRVLVIERKIYPFHRVCGEYISNETRPFLTTMGLDLRAIGVAEINQFQFTSPSGRMLTSPLDLGGFGLSRYTLDFALYELAQQQGVQFWLNTTVETVQQGATFSVTTTDGKVSQSQLVLGAYGKRTKLDAWLQRPFFTKRSPYIGVKYHIQTDFPKDLIALHNFKDGYCGISAIEDQKYCLCYLTTRENLRKTGSIAVLEQQILWRNPHLKRIFTEATFLYDKPEVINEISFAPKSAVENGMLMVGDAAGLITPLCGNGMAMAIHGAKIAAELAVQYLDGKLTRPEVERRYTKAWQRQFSQRLWVGRQVQRLFGDEWISELAAHFFRLSPAALRAVMQATHGEVF